MAYYLEIGQDVIEKCVNRNHLICNPLRVDNNPTAGFYIDKKGRLRFNDFAGFFHGDMYDLVGYRTLLSPYDPHEFMLILHRICKDFGLWYYGLHNQQSMRNLLKQVHLYAKEHTKIDVQRKEWEWHDMKYWRQYGLEPEVVEKAYITPVYAAWVNGTLVYSAMKKDPCYGIYHGLLDGEEQWKLYFPYRTGAKAPRFITNTRRMQNMGAVKEAPYGVITKAIKDALVLNVNGVQSVGLAAESILPTEQEIAYLKHKWGKVYSLLDFDHAGVKMAKKLLKSYGIPALFLTTGKGGTFDYGAKDISDFSKKYGADTTKALIDLVVSQEATFNRDYYEELANIITPF